MYSGLFSTNLTSIAYKNITLIKLNIDINKPGANVHVKFDAFSISPNAYIYIQTYIFLCVCVFMHVFSMYTHTQTLHTKRNTRKNKTKIQKHTKKNQKKNVKKATE